MKRIRSLGRYQKSVLIFMGIMTLAFFLLYAALSAREGFAWQGSLLIPRQEEKSTVYSGKIQGKEAAFTVYEDGRVEFRYGEKIYGPYTAREDLSAIPQGHGMTGRMTGVELREGDAVLFRGGVTDMGILYNEDGSLAGMPISVESGGTILDEKGELCEKPSVGTLLALMAGPELTHRGEWGAWFGGVVICLMGAASILFEKELFRWNLAFLIRNTDQEPSQWEVARRYAVWTVLPVMALILFLRGLG